jgi:hypothetical protein
LLHKHIKSRSNYPQIRGLITKLSKRIILRAFSVLLILAAGSVFVGAEVSFLAPAIERSLPAEFLLAKERFLAEQSLKNLAPDNFLARLMVSEPVDDNSKRTTNTSDLPLNAVAQDKSFLDGAWVSFNSNSNIWTAKWAKPRLFHFGSILKPALLRKFEVGQSFAFESKGAQAILTKTGTNEICIVKDGSKTPLDAGDLRRLLENKISADGLSLFLDRGGNLILQAQGPLAVKLASQG